jgi:hypothetical protein
VWDADSELTGAGKQRMPRVQPVGKFQRALYLPSVRTSTTTPARLIIAPPQLQEVGAACNRERLVHVQEGVDPRPGRR